MVVESSSDDFKAGYCKVGFKTLLRPQDSHGLDNTNTCLIVDENIFWFRICVKKVNSYSYSCTTCSSEDNLFQNLCKCNGGESRAVSSKILSRSVFFGSGQMSNLHCSTRRECEIGLLQTCKTNISHFKCANVQMQCTMCFCFYIWNMD